MSTIVVGYDASDCARAALSTAINVATAYSDDVRVVVAYEVSRLGGEVQDFARALSEQAQEIVRLADDQAAVLAIGALAAWCVLRLVFLAGLAGSFRAQQKVAAGLEDLLGFYAPGRFGPDSGPAFPAAWLAAGAKKSGGVLFRSTRPLLDVGVFMLLVSIASRSDWVRAWTAQLLRLVGL